MPYSVEWTEKGYHLTFTGKAIAQEIAEGTLGIVGSERFDFLKYALADFSQVTSVDATEKEIKEIAYLDMASARSNPNLKLFIVAHQDDIKRLSAFYIKFAEDSPWEVNVFDTIEEAKQAISSL